MTDYEEKAKEIVLAADLAYSYLQIPVPLRAILEKEIANALAAVREDCAKEREEVRRIAVALLIGDYSANERDKWRDYLRAIRTGS